MFIFTKFNVTNGLFSVFVSRKMYAAMLIKNRYCTFFYPLIMKRCSKLTSLNKWDPDAMHFLVSPIFLQPCFQILVSRAIEFY